MAGAALPGAVSAHGVAQGDRAFLTNSVGAQIVPFIYLGAKHMVTGYDHLLFLFGVIFFLYRLREIAAYVTLFAIGHSVTLLYGVLSGAYVNAYIIDAIIGLSVVYKALDNMGAFQRFFGAQPNTKAAVLIFGFFHGFGLATKLQEFALSRQGLVENIVAFNVGVEIGQILALSAILIAMNYWRRTASFLRHSYVANAVLVAGAIVVTVVLPAEYGVDPTRVGRLLGLTAMGEAKSTASATNAGAAAPAASGDASVMHDHKNKYFTGRVEIEMAGLEELEYKAALAKGEPLLYEWTTQGGPVYFEFHGEPTEGKWPEGFYQSYQIGESSEGEAGSFIAPFTGVHGWYWRNPNDKPVTITLQAVGYYTSLGRVGG